MPNIQEIHALAKIPDDFRTVAKLNDNSPDYIRYEGRDFRSLTSALEAAARNGFSHYLLITAGNITTNNPYYA